MQKIIVVVAVAAAVACGRCSAAAYQAHFARETAGNVGCRERDIAVSDIEQNGWSGRSTWTAECRGHRYFCTQGGDGALQDTSPHGTHCTEEVSDVAANGGTR